MKPLRSIMFSVTAVALVLGSMAVQESRADQAQPGEQAAESAAQGNQSPQARAPGQQADRKDVATVLSSEASVATFYKALKETGIADQLKAGGPYTVFAPNNESFAQLAEGKWEELSKPENRAQLISILNHHVVAEKVLAGDLIGDDQRQASLRSRGGENLRVTKQQNGQVMIEKAKVVKSNIEASNGVVYVVSGLIMPAASGAAPGAEAPAAGATPERE